MSCAPHLNAPILLAAGVSFSVCSVSSSPCAPACRANRNERSAPSKWARKSEERSISSVSLAPGFWSGWRFFWLRTTMSRSLALVASRVSIAVAFLLVGKGQAAGCGV
ncbi:MAG: hypothetical protein RJA36_2341 [Pseudomonadota bacterium]